MVCWQVEKTGWQAREALTPQSAQHWVRRNVTLSLFEIRQDCVCRHRYTTDRATKPRRRSMAYSSQTASSRAPWVRRAVHSHPWWSRIEHDREVVRVARGSIGGAALCGSQVFSCLAWRLRDSANGTAYNSRRCPTRRKPSSCATCCCSSSIAALLNSITLPVRTSIR